VPTPIGCKFLKSSAGLKQKPIKASNERRHYTDTRRTVKSFYFFIREVTFPAEFFLLAASYLSCCFTPFF
jgi:hypothetical protein